jgi:hypothetical protein
MNFKQVYFNICFLYVCMNEQVLLTFHMACGQTPTIRNQISLDSTTLYLGRKTERKRRFCHYIIEFAVSPARRFFVRKINTHTRPSLVNKTLVSLHKKVPTDQISQ